MIALHLNNWRSDLISKGIALIWKTIRINTSDSYAALQSISGSIVESRTQSRQFLVEVTRKGTVCPSSIGKSEDTVVLRHSKYRTGVQV